jgi:hypothetical protein
MKTKNIIRICGVAMMSAMCLSSCDSILEEDPHGIYTPSYFKTKEGAESGITSLYAHLRNLYGNGYFLTSLEVGTDEYTYGHSADGNQKDIDMTGVGQITSQVCSNAYWNQAFTDINTASSVIEIATEVGLSDALIAEARFFRGMHYLKTHQGGGTWEKAKRG